MAFQSTFWKKSQTRLIGILQGEIPVDERNKMMHSKLYERGVYSNYRFPEFNACVQQSGIALSEYLNQTNFFDTFINEKPRDPFDGPLNCGFVDAFINFPSSVQKLTKSKTETLPDYYVDPKSIPTFQEYVISSTCFSIETGVGYFNKPANSTSIMIHKLIGVDTKDCIQKIEYNLKFQNEFVVCNKHQVLDFATFQQNKFVLTLSNEESIFEVLKALRKLPPNAYKEYRTTISFCQMVDKDGRDFDLTLIKDLSADLRKVLWECFIGSNTKNSYLDDWRIQIIKSRARVHILPKGSFNISNNDDETLVVNNLHSLVYEEAIEMQNGNDFKCLS